MQNFGISVGICKIFASEFGFNLGVMRGFQKGITLGGRASGSFQNSGVAKMDCKKICKIFASELGFKLGVMRGFQKGITLWGRTSGSVRKVSVGGGLLEYRVTLSPYFQ